MATEKNSGFTSRGSVLTTEMNALAAAAYTVRGPEYDNTSTLDSWGVLQLLLKAMAATVTVNKPINVFAVTAPDGSTYQDGSDSLRPPDDTFVGTFQVYNNTSDQLLLTRPFKLKPVKMKFIVYNGTDKAFAATLNVLTLFTFNRTIN